jgi:DNA-binding CsgD family transcriptional regulator
LTVKTRSATIAVKDEADFGHKASHVLAAEGYPKSRIAAVLGLSERSIRRHLSRHCAAYEQEMAERAARLEIENRNRASNQGFCRADDHLSDKIIYLRDLRKNIARMRSEGMSVSGTGYELDISRQVVQYHIGLMVRADRVAKPLGRKRIEGGGKVLKVNDFNSASQLQKIYI